jgi:ATP phosphoribosyltransferase
MLRIAVPNKGTLSESATVMLREAGYKLRTNSKTLVSRDDVNGIEFFYLRPRDIAVYIGEGILDLGITGRDLLLESGAAALETLPLGFGRSRFHYASRAGTFTDVTQLEGKRIATSYPVLVQRDLAARGIDARTVGLDGAVEVSIELGVADAIADVVETGTTLRQAGLETFGDPIMRSEGLLVAPVEREELSDAAQVVVRRLESVMVARSYVIAVTPGFESPTVSPMRDPEWVAVRSMVSADAQHTVMDRLYSVGARAILVTNIAACRV